MAEFSKIEWTDHTFNPWMGCQKVSPGCDRCYAETLMDHRYKVVQWGPRGKRIRTSDANWKNPIKWAKKAAEVGLSARVFCASLADIFDNQADRSWRSDLFELIRMTPELDWLLLTKRPQNCEQMLPADWNDGYPNVWLGTTAEDQQRFNHRWPILRQIPAKIRFISFEPAIGPLTVDAARRSDLPDWIICGGETGAGARYMKGRWARRLRDECRNLGIAFFMKQMTNREDIPPKLLIRQFPEQRRPL